jgi:hypothetical protein
MPDTTWAAIRVGSTFDVLEAVDRQDGEDRRPERDEEVRPHSCRVLVDLALQPDRRTEDGGDQHPDREVRLQGEIDLGHWRRTSGWDPSVTAV